MRGSIWLCIGTLLLLLTSWQIMVGVFFLDKIFYLLTHSACRGLKTFFFFLCLVSSSEETSFLTNFYGLYFSLHYTHITHYRWGGLKTYEEEKKHFFVHFQTLFVVFSRENTEKVLKSSKNDE